jgi:hypothetical protein
VPRPEVAKPQDRVVAQIVRIEKRPPPTPRPTPHPTPRLTPTPAPRYTLAPRVAVRAPAPRAAATPHRKVGGAAARKHLATPQPRVPSPRPKPPQSLAQGTHAGVQNGGSGTGAGAGAGDSGAGGSGTGSAGTGNGTGGNADTAPCGYVTFFGKYDHSDRGGTRYVHVRIEVTLRNGTVLSDELHWFFVYPNERSDPFATLNARADLPTPMQLPPPGFDMSRQQPATVFALQHTTPDGYTTLPACPGQTAPQS